TQERALSDRLEAEKKELEGQVEELREEMRKANASARSEKTKQLRQLKMHLNEVISLLEEERQAAKKREE
ncbi:hypothetical protein PMAYCL1PPCAC_09809, partial [Pristionchus mayeri]